MVVKEVGKSFGGLVALDDVSLEVERGKLTMLIGPNGSGKTTLINVISGFYKPERGRVFYEGVDVTGLPPNKRYGLGIVRTFQIPSPFIKLSVLENLLVSSRSPGERFIMAPIKKFWARKEEEEAKKAFEIMKLLELSHLWDAPAQTLSGGQLKLLEVGRALMTGAKLILMDEPASGINPALAHKIFSHLVEIKDKLGTTFFIVEHRLEVAVQYVDYVFAMAQGKVISQGTCEKVLNDPKVIEGYLGG